MHMWEQETRAERYRHVNVKKAKVYRFIGVWQQESGKRPRLANGAVRARKQLTRETTSHDAESGRHHAEKIPTKHVQKKATRAQVENHRSQKTRMNRA